MAEPKCHYCDRDAEEQCPTCGRLYCYDHGDDACLRCISPEAAAPSSVVYRGALLTLVAATAVAVFLFVRPPASKSEADTVRTLATPTQSNLATATPTPPGGGPTRAATAAATAPPVATPVASGTAGAKTHLVASGETLSQIAEANNTTVDAIIALNPGITADSLPVGTVLNLP